METQGLTENAEIPTTLANFLRRIGYRQLEPPGLELWIASNFIIWMSCAIFFLTWTVLRNITGGGTEGTESPHFGAFVEWSLFASQIVGCLITWGMLKYIWSGVETDTSSFRSRLVEEYIGVVINFGSLAISAALISSSGASNTLFLLGSGFLNYALACFLWRHGESPASSHRK